MSTLVIDCSTCTARGPACRDCVVSALIDAPDAAGAALADEEVRALGALSAGGLLPPLRLVRPVAPAGPEGAGGAGVVRQPEDLRLDFG